MPEASPPNDRSRQLAARFNALLVLVVVIFALGPILPKSALLAHAVRFAIEVILVTAIWQLRRGPALPVVVTLIMVGNEASEWLAQLGFGEAFTIASAILTLLFLACGVGFLSWTFWTARHTGPGSLAGAASAYLLLGFFWAQTFVLLEVADPGSFRDVCAPRPDGVVDCDPAKGYFPRLTYFGFVTMTTLGYGDVVPLTDEAERLASLSALTGQLFVAVLIGRMVALAVPAASGPEP